jgi:hypothetical protein
MIALLSFFLTLLVSPFRSKSRLEAENAALRHQLFVLRRKVRGRVQLTNGDRLFLVLLYRWFLHLYERLETRGRVLLLCLLCAEAGWLILVTAWLWLERAYLKLRLFLRV